MSWILQPHNWGQALQKNLYNVGYRRNAVYKGMGQDGPNIYHATAPAGGGLLNCPGDPGCPGNVGPQDLQSQIDNMWAYIQGGGTLTPTDTTAPTVNYTPWLILGGGLLLVMMASRR